MSGKVEMTLKRKDVRKSRYIANVSPRAKDGYVHAKGQAKNRFFFSICLVDEQCGGLLLRWWSGVVVSCYPRRFYLASLGFLFSVKTARKAFTREKCFVSLIIPVFITFQLNFAISIRCLFIPFSICTLFRSTSFNPSWLVTELKRWIVFTSLPFVLCIVRSAWSLRTRGYQLFNEPLRHCWKDRIGARPQYVHPLRDRKQRYCLIIQRKKIILFWRLIWQFFRGIRKQLSLAEWKKKRKLERERPG